MVTPRLPLLRALGTIVSVVLCAVLLLPGVAAADAARPTNLRAEVTGVAGTGPDEPADPPPIEVRVRGGDAFLELRVARGATAAMSGYDGEPYLRVAADGTVERNRRSPTTYLNERRTGATDVPPTADAAAPPDWERVADDGIVAFHDHRIHWMGEGAPPVGQDGVVQRWTVPLTVNDRPVSIDGVLRYEPDVAPWPWLLVFAAVAAAIWLLPGSRPRQVALVAASLLAGIVAAGEYLASPAGTVGLPGALLVTAVALIAALADLVRPGQVAPLASSAALLGWVVLRWAVLVRPIVPTTLPVAFDRAGTAVVAGVAAAVAARVVLQPARRPAVVPEATSP